MQRGRLLTFLGLGVMALVLAAFGPPPEDDGGGNQMLLAAESPPDSLDPGVSYMAASWMLQVNVYNGLLTYRKTDGKDATDLVPDLATAMPRISEGGRVLTFTMRRGVKFGPPLNREVLPSDLKYTFDRNVRMPSQGAFYYDVLEGVEPVKAGKAKTISGVIADDAARTIEFHLTRPDATFLYVLALPFSFAVPKGTPLTDRSTQGFIPATGPYMFTAYDPQRHIRLERNPAFRQWTPHTPRGRVDRIEVQLKVSPENAVTLVKRGRLDAMMSGIPRSKLPELLADEGWKEQVHQHEQARTSYFWMNTTTAPFRDPRVRQAINWAIDRRAVVKLSGGQGVPSSTILPPTMPGYRDHKLYARQDMDRARALIRASGITPGRLDIWCMTAAPGPDIAQYLQEQLRQLGFDTRTRCVDSSAYYTLIGAKQTGAKIGFASWGQDFPEGSNFIDVLLNGAHVTPQQSNNYAFYKGHDEEIARINAMLDLDERAAAWGRLDREIVASGVWAPLMHGVTYQLVSKRVGCYVHHPVYDLLLSQATVDGEECAGAGAAAADGGGQP